jgi:predicted O-linked N-acetylglucosamine transferase (SPINDLY family)
METRLRFMTIPQAFELALRRHQARRLADAEALYRQILAARPNHGGAMHFLGLIAHQSGRDDFAVEWIRQAIVLDPNNPFAHSNLGEAFRTKGQLEDAAAEYRHALALKPDYPEAHNNLGIALREQGVDIVLDTFPYNGHTTSLDALWMGVPVVSLAGNAPVSRAGLSQLSNLGLPELVARSESEYVTIAERLAADLPRLAELRATLRPRMQASPLMDASRFARNVEAAYRSMWERWCASGG